MKYIQFVNDALFTRFDTAIHNTIPADAIKVTDEVFFETINNTSVQWVLINGVITHRPLPAITTDEIIEQYSQAVQKRLDDFAKTRNYDSNLSACTYATSTVAKFKAEGQYSVNARDNTWSTCYAIMAKVLAGTTPMPTLAALMASLPVLAWPV